MKHISPLQFKKYRQRKLPPAELLQVDDHFASCESCRTELWRAVYEQHLTYDQMADHVQGMRNPAVSDHIAACPSCRAEVEDLSEFRVDLQARREADSVHTMRFLLLASVLVAAVSASLWFYSPAFNEQASPAANPAVSLVASLNDAGGILAVENSGVLAAASTMAPEFRDRVARVLLEPGIPRSPSLVGLARKEETLLSDTSVVTRIELGGPIGIVVVDDKPVFRWGALAGAERYVVSVFDMDFRKVAESPAITGTEWRADTGLRRDAVYSWQVTAFVRNERIRWPMPPAPEAVFKVASQSEYDRLAAVQQETRSHLLMTILYAEAGALDDAERELQALALSNPGSAVVRQLAADLRSIAADQRP